MDQNPQQINNCPLCRNSAFSPYRFGLLGCDTCGLVLSPAIWLAQVNEQMEDEWFGESYEQRYSSFWVEWFEAWNNRATLSRLTTMSHRGKRLLEIGVGSGSFLKAAKDKGWDVQGCDLSEPICRRVEREVGVPMHCGPVASLDAEGRFDVVVLNHVLEHVQHPVAFLREVRRLLAPGGFAHIAVPNIACWESRLSGWTSYEPYHLSYFDRQTLARAVAAAGLSLGQIGTKDSFSGWFLALLRTAVGADRKHGAITRPLAASVSRQRTGLVEHGYRLAMVLAGGGAMALALAARAIGLWRRANLHGSQICGCSGVLTANVC